IHLSGRAAEMANSIRIEIFFSFFFSAAYQTPTLPHHYLHHLFPILPPSLSLSPFLSSSPSTYYPSLSLFFPLSFALSCFSFIFSPPPSLSPSPSPSPSPS